VVLIPEPALSAAEGLAPKSRARTWATDLRAIKDGQPAARNPSTRPTSSVRFSISPNVPAELPQFAVEPTLTWFASASLYLAGDSLPNVPSAPG
jgi:hypothetical protein